MKKQLTKTELRKCVQAYSALFPGWTPLGGIGFMRVSGPVAQKIWLEALSYGAYRPASGVSILVARSAGMLHQFLDVKHREVLPAEHDAMFDRMCRAMQEQFVPSITAPLEVNEVCRLCEERAVERIGDARSLAALHAYLGNTEAANKWLDEVARLASEKSELYDYDKERMAAADQIKVAMSHGTVMELLEDIRHSELARLSNL